MNFVIVAAARTGSSHLSWYLGRHPEICCHGESFHPKRVHIRYRKGKAGPDGKQRLQAELMELRAKNPDTFLDRLFALDNGRPHVGFKIFEKHHPKMLRSILKDENIRKVVLFRANALARYASSLAAKQTHTWGAKPERPAVEFDARRFAKHTADYLAFFERTLQMLNRSGQSYFLIRSDELNNELRLAQLVNFIGATQTLARAESGIERHRGAFDIASRFSNSHDVLEYLKSHGLMHWAYEGDLSFQPSPAEELASQDRSLV